MFNYITHKMQDIRVIFDPDGLIIDNDRYHILARIQIFPKYGAELIAQWHPEEPKVERWLIALEYSLGIGHYQTVRHDIWDRDLLAPPNRVRVRQDHQLIDAVAQYTGNDDLSRI